MTNPLEQMGQAAKEASYALAPLSSAAKNTLLLSIADAVEAAHKSILSANAKDMQAAKQSDMESAMQDRLMLDQKRLAGMAADIRQVSSLADPVGRVLDGATLDSGLKLQKVCVPLGVVAAIYEARPNVTTDIASLCLKTGNAVILRGGKETTHSNAALVEAIHKALKKQGLPQETVQAVTNPDRALISALLELDSYIDMLIPRGGAGLQRFCAEASRIPVITGGIGVCHIFMDKSANQDKSIEVIINAKVQRPSVCNSLETLLVHREIAELFLPRLANSLADLGVTLHLDDIASGILAGSKCSKAKLRLEDLAKEWLTLDLNVVVVDDLASAVQHIRKYGSAHSDSILTENMTNASAFVAAVDSSAVYVNASTRFTDGGQFGLGAEVAISTQKLHARGPMGLEALTTYKWVAYGDYTVRP